MRYTLQVGVKVVLKNKKGEFLILKRSPEEYKNVKHLWDIPGGRIDPETNLIDNLKREVFEETKINLEGETFEILGAQDIFHGEDKHTVRITFGGMSDINPILSEEHIDFRWVSSETALKMTDLDPYLKQILEQKI